MLVKLLFTSEKLSVQVHPGDAYAAEHESSRGKTEMWYVLRADNDSPGVAAGLSETVSPERLRQISLSGEIEKLLNWIRVSPGDVIFIPAGTIHAIGPGLVLCEIQQQSDVTYRLYDYGRGRELHLDRAIDVAIAGPPPPDGLLAKCEYFAVEDLHVDRPLELSPKQNRFEMFVMLEGSGTIAGRPFQLGQVWHTHPGTPPFTLAPEHPTHLLRVWVP